MNKKKLCAGTLALALSIGSIAPGITTSYADTEVENRAADLENPANNDTNQSNGDDTQNAPATDSTNSADEEKKSTLKAYVDERETVEQSPRYTNASKFEKEAYTKAINAIDAAVKEESIANYNTLVENIENAKKNLGANLAKSADSRDALRINIATADELKSDLSLSSKSIDKLKAAIDKAKKDLADVELSDSQIVASNIKLSEVIAEVADNDNIEVSKYTLTNSDLNKLKSEDNVAYNRLRANLLSLINEVDEFKKTEAYENLKGKDSEKTILANEGQKAQDAYDNLSSSLGTLQAAYNNLQDSYNKLATAIDAKNTQLSRDRTTLSELVNAKHSEFVGTDAYNTANKFSKANYEQAVENAKSLLDDDNASLAQIQSALRNVSITKLSVVPVKTKTIDNGTPSDNKQANLEELNTLLNEFESIKNQDAYKKATTEARTMYDNAIAAAKLIKDKTNPTQEEINEAAKTIKNAKDGLKAKDDTPLDENIKKAREELYALAQNRNNVMNSDSYKSATNAQKKSYTEAVNSASKLLTDYANKTKTPNLEDINKAKKAITDALTAMGYVEPVKYPTTIDEILAEAETFKSSPNYLAKKSGSKEDKDLVETYDNLIKEANQYKNTVNPKAEVLSQYVERINEIKKTINNEMSYDELSLRSYVRQAERVINSDDFNKVLQERRERLKEAHKKAKDLLASNDLTDAKISSAISDLEAALRPDDIQKILNSGKDDDSSAKVDKYDVRNMSLEELIALATKVKAHDDYKQVGQTQKKSFEEALEAAKNAKSDEEKKEAQTALISALNQSEIKLIVAKVRNNEAGESANLKELKDLIVFAGKVIDHTDYTNVDKDLRDQLAKALISAKQAVESNDEIKIAAAKAELNRLLSDERLADIVKAIKEGNKDLTSRQIIEKIIAEDAEFRKTDKFKRAKKDLKKTYTEALTKASEVAKNTNASEDDLKVASDALIAAKNALDGDQFVARLKALKEKYEKEKAKITDANKKAEIEKLIAGLDSEDASMDELIAAETALSNALPKGTVEVTTTPSTTTTTTTKPVPTTTTTTTPVTTTSTVPSTVTPGSIVRTGIKSLIGVVILLAVAVGAFVITGKNKDNKNKNKRTFESDSSKKEN